MGIRHSCTNPLLTMMRGRLVYCWGALYVAFFWGGLALFFLFCRFFSLFGIANRQYSNLVIFSEQSTRMTHFLHNKTLFFTVLDQNTDTSTSSSSLTTHQVETLVGIAHSQTVRSGNYKGGKMRALLMCAIHIFCARAAFVHNRCCTTCHRRISPPSLLVKKYNVMIEGRARQRKKNMVMKSNFNEGKDTEKGIKLLPEEILLKIDFSSILDTESALEKLRAYLRRFPFSAVLPVQPLTYLPSDNGVTVTFLRKKTAEKGSEDGGLILDAVVDDDAPLSTTAEDDDAKRSRFKLIVTRNSGGQTVSKVFSEGLVVQALVKRLGGDQDEIGLRVESVFHRWL